MKHWIYFLLLTILSCNNRQEKDKSAKNSGPIQAQPATKPQDKSDKENCWIGTLGGKTPVFINYRLSSNVVVGEITYLNTKDKLPIRIVGTVEENKSYRLLEFDKKGNITGVIEGAPTQQEFTGSWVSPKTKKELEMKLAPKDTLINNQPFRAGESEAFGNYHYQYGKSGYSGDFEFRKVDGEKAAFHILSLTNVERGPNVAEVRTDTISFKGDNFVYKIPGSDNCEFKVTFYKGFVYINYTKGYCEGEFGMNATIDGIYLKTE